MKALFLTILLFSQATLASNVELLVGSAQREQFSFQIKENPMEIGITRDKSDEQIIKLKNSVSDAAKLALRLTGKDGRVITQELLFVVTSVANTQQDIMIFAPVRLADIVLSSKIDPICKVRNHGDFYWDDATELLKKLKVVEKDQTAYLQVMAKTDENKEASFVNTGCSFRLLKN